MSYNLRIPLYTMLASPSNYGKKRALNYIDYIVVHYTANDGDTDTNNGNYFRNNYVGASAHYFVDEDSVTRSVPDEYVAWHCESRGMALKCGCRNSNSIGVEMCSDVDKKTGKYILTPDTVKNAVEVVKWLMDKYNVPPERVIRHYDVCGKLCPEPWVRDESLWIDFKRTISEKTEEKKEDDEVVVEGRMKVNGIDIKNEKIVKDGVTYAKVRGFEAAGFEVDYNNDTKLITVKNKVKEVPLKVNGKSTSVEGINIEGHNFVPIRSICAALGVNVDFVKGLTILTSPNSAPVAVSVPTAEKVEIQEEQAAGQAAEATESKE